MAYTYISTSGNESVLIESTVILRGGNIAKVYYFVKPESVKKEHKLAKDLPKGYEVQEVTKNGFPLVRKIVKEEK